jgi:hypothetical protein
VADATVEFAGRTFRVADKVGLMPLMRFAHIARQGVDASDMDGLAAIYDLLRSAIADEDWRAFEDHATDVRADGDELLAIATEAIQVVAARPTVEPSDSSDGQPTASRSSADGSSSEVIARLEAQGRPSIALMVQQADQGRASLRSA